MKFTDKEIQIIKLKYLGNCAYCGEELSDIWYLNPIEPAEMGITYDTLTKRWTGDNKLSDYDIDRFSPSCELCHSHKGDSSMEEFRDSIKTFIKIQNWHSGHYRMLKKFNLVTETGAEVKFFFETFQETNNWCSCEFVIVQRDRKTDKAYCYECKKPIKE